MNAESRQERWALAIAEAEKRFTEIAVADGNLVTYQREATLASQCVSGSDALQKCDTESLRNAIINVASVGLTINPAMKLAYLVPRKGKVCLDISYIGLVKIATDSGGVLAVSAILVRANDRFTYNGPFDAPIHEFNPFANESGRGGIIGVYSLAKLASGVTQVDTLSWEELEKIRAMSKASSGPWFDWFEEMAKKSVIKRASKLWPRTERLARAEEILNEHQGNETVIDGATGEIITPVRMPQSKSASAQPDDKPPYPPEKFTANLPAWRKLIASGKKTAEQIIATVSSKGTLTEAQRAAIAGTTNSSGAPTVTFEQVKYRLQRAGDLDVLDADADLIGEVADPKGRAELSTLYKQRREELSNIPL